MKFYLGLFLFLCFNSVFSQESGSNYRTKRYRTQDTIKIDTVSINSSRFVVKTKGNRLVDSTHYKIDFLDATLVFKKTIDTDTIIVDYLRYPDFLTRSYSQLSKSVIVNSSGGGNTLYQLSQSNKSTDFKPFDGLSTSGSISRGVTVGSNQNSVLNSELDLQITGKLSDKVSIRASIQDANIPLQESGYSQRLDEFDQVFIELTSDSWRIRAGDIDLNNTASYFAKFNKRVQGLFVNFDLGTEEQRTNLFASGALVRGQFTSSQFTAQEGNQGPYKLRGPNDELYVLIVSGSEIVYVNGIPLERGENKDYIIDYNAGEIIFNSTFPITSEMRIIVDYQYSERNYSRFTFYGGGKHKTDKLEIGAYLYSESDSKNQPLQQNLSPEQTQILADAGDDRSLMVSPSAVEEAFSENRILYTKEIVDDTEIFVFSNNPDAEQLYSVKFTLVGVNQGDYVLVNSNAISNIFEYVPPVNGVKQGNYDPITQLVAPVKLQMAVVNATYTPSDKTNVFLELAASKNDLNLFSNIDNENNDGYALKLKADQNLVKNDTLWRLDAIVEVDYIDTDFRNIEPLYAPEFNRDWNIDNPNRNQLITDFGNQMLFKGRLVFSHTKTGLASYNFEYLDFTETLKGSKHSFLVDSNIKNLNIYSNSSILSNTGALTTSNFLRSFNRVVYNFNAQWAGVKLSFEDNQQTELETSELSELSQKFSNYEVFYGIGDSTKVFGEVGYKFRANDSLRSGSLQEVNRSNTYYINTKLIQNSKTNLGVYANYRRLNNVEADVEDEQSFNSRLNFSQQLFSQIVFLNTTFETNSGTLAQQEFTYVEVEPGQGAYTWIDYNGNGIQELDEFELAQFQDEGNYIRVLLPNQVFVKTHQNRLSQLLTLNPQGWHNSEKKSKRFWSHFYSQTSYLIDRKILREDNTFDINPFEDSSENQLGLNKSVRTVLFYNRGKQRFTTSYTFLNSSNRALLATGLIENNSKSHQFKFLHKIGKSWLVDADTSWEEKESISENFVSRNFNLNEFRLRPKLSYILNENVRFDAFYKFTSKDNTINDMEQLEQHNLGTSFTYNTSKKISFNGEVNYFKNDFEGNPNTPVAYQLLEGLQAGNNFTWSILGQWKLTKFLDLNLSYFGRKTETSSTIHTGTMQLKAYF